MVSSFETTIFTEVMPTRAICNPMPIIVDIFTDFGIAFMITSVKPLTDDIHNMMPDTKHYKKNIVEVLMRR